MKPIKRISFEDYLIKMAMAASERSEDPYTQVGAVAADDDHRIIATAYNGLPSGIKVTERFWLDREARLPYMVHAEQNLCSLFSRNQVHTVALTISPCASCAVLLAAHGVKRIIFKEEYHRDTKAFDVLKMYNIKIEQFKPE